MSSLYTLKFNEGGLDDAPAGDALAEALRITDAAVQLVTGLLVTVEVTVVEYLYQDIADLYDIPQNGYHTGGNLDGKRHCVLVASGNPYPYDRWFIKPNIDGCGNTYSCFSDETVARWFAQCSVSLSVICTRNIPKIRTLYQLAKRNPNAEDPLVQVYHSDFVVLISEDFKEALTALGAIILAPCHNALSPISSAPCQNSPNPTSPTCTAPHQNTLDPSSPKQHQNDLVPTIPALNQDLDPTSPAPNQYATIQTSQVPNQADFDPTNPAPSQDALNPPIAVLSQEVLYSSGPVPPQEAVTPLHPEVASTSNQPECIPTSKTLHESVGDISIQRLHNEPSCLKPHTLSFLKADTVNKLSLQTISLPALSVNLFCDIEDIQWSDNDVVESMLETIFKYDICFSESPEITLTAVPDFASGSMGPGSGTVTDTSQFVKNQNESFMVSALIEDQIPITSELQPSSLLLDTISSMERAPASQIEDILVAKLQNTVLNKSQVVNNSNECPKSGLTTGTCRSVENLNVYSRSVAYTKGKFQVAAQHQPFGIPQSPYSILGQETSSHKDNSLANLDKTWLNMPPKIADDVIRSSLNPRFGTTTSASKLIKKRKQRSKVTTSIKGNIPSTTQKQFSSHLPETTPNILGQVTSHEDNLGANLPSSLLNIPPKSLVHLAGSSLSLNLDETLPKVPSKFKVVELPNGSSYFSLSVIMTQSLKVSSSLANAEYVKLWEGDFCGKKCGKAALISRVEAFKMTASASVMLAEDWPNSIRVAGLMPLEKMKHEFDVSRAVLLVFRVLTSRSLLKLLKEKGIGLIVDLPSQTLILSVSDDVTRLLGLISPKVAPKARTQTRRRIKH
ncbi:uncharacterized protein LOC141641808 [Silene latifolia]|uniref:uncharacterized protein LOC141641808 n=1 Tax=Silene latifolia TaxID=37657 RepID=UPI003D787A63